MACSGWTRMEEVIPMHLGLLWHDVTQWRMDHVLQTDEYVRPKSEVTYNAQFPYGSDGYRTDCNNIPVSLLVDINDHTTDIPICAILI